MSVTDLHPTFLPPDTRDATPIWFVNADTWLAQRGRLSPPERAFADAAGFKPDAGNHLLLPGEGGVLSGALFAVEKPGKAGANFFLPGKLATILPAGRWRFASAPHDARLAALSFALGLYRFTRYRKVDAKDLRLVVPDGVDGAELSRIVEAVFLVRDLVNTPSNDCGPAEIESAARAMAERFGAKFRSIVGDDLLKENFPLVHAVGRASSRAPRLIEFTWGDEKHPRVALVGKGVSFDTGGLDIKTSAGMLLMKKDMGGAANALGLAQMIMAAKLRVRLHVVIAAVENSISGDSFRPGDVIKSRKSETVEIGNTDAEGRLILADALTLADESSPELIVDFATLTGAARVALGPDLPAAFTGDDALAGQLARCATAEADPCWRMPLWQPYRSMLDSRIADMNNVGTAPLAGAIVAALFLARFVERAKSWLHLDLFAWNPSAKPGRPEGGEAQTIRALMTFLTDRYG
jgi:leucyl aminopeptidase